MLAAIAVALLAAAPGPGPDPSPLRSGIDLRKVAIQHAKVGLPPLRALQPPPVEPKPLSTAEVRAVIDQAARSANLAGRFTLAPEQPLHFSLSHLNPARDARLLLFGAYVPGSPVAVFEQESGWALQFPVRKGQLYLVDCTAMLGADAKVAYDAQLYERNVLKGSLASGESQAQAGHVLVPFIASGDGVVTLRQGIKRTATRIAIGTLYSCVVTPSRPG